MGVTDVSSTLRFITRFASSVTESGAILTRIDSERLPHILQWDLGETGKEAFRNLSGLILYNY